MDFSSLDAIVSSLNGFLYSYILIFVLLGAGLYYTISTKGVQFDVKNATDSFKEGIRAEESDRRKITPFQAFAVTTASRVGTGNLAGVAIAVAVGGPGAIFWMWVTALLGGALAFVESTLAQVYKVRESASSGQEMRFIGGPAYYMTKGLGLKGFGYAFSFIVIFVFGFSFNAVQSNTIASAFHSSFAIPNIVTGIIIAGLSGVFIFKGLPAIARASALIVPVMATLYVVLCLIVVLAHITRIPEVFAMILENAFGLKEFGAGTIAGTITTGIKRGLFSNEAGMGSAPNAAASADTSHPVKQGFIQAVGVFFDTIVICSATGFLILFSGVDFQQGASGIILTQQALGTFFGQFGSIFLSICILLLAFSSVLGNYFYARNSLAFITNNPRWSLVFKIAVVVSVFAGSVSSFTLVWDIADLLMGIMALMNIYAIIRLSGILHESIFQRAFPKALFWDPYCYPKY